MSEVDSEAVRQLFQHRRFRIDEVDAVVAANDDMAVGVIEELFRLGTRVPRQLAVVGFDDMAFAQNLRAPLFELLRRAMLQPETSADGARHPISLTIIDLDGFKQVNDLRGQNKLVTTKTGDDVALSDGFTSASLGIATMAPGAEPWDADELIRRADQALLRAKATGKARAVHWSSI
jgi:GGDEF domain-containing protein